jgi:hypothetical protein
MFFVALCIETYFSMTYVSRYERMFEEMLGSRDKLPVIARSVIEVSRWQQNNILIIALPVIAWLGYICAQRRKLWVRVTNGVLAAALALYCVVGFFGLKVPAFQLIQSLGVPAP